nr:hypothetical protein [Kineococcus vitellinus]
MHDGVFERAVSTFDDDVSNATALFEPAGGGSMRTNEFRRVGYPSPAGVSPAPRAASVSGWRGAVADPRHGDAPA